MNNKTILYILSDERSGSTLLENLLSKSTEIVSVGELRLLESHINKGVFGRTWDWKCSCGKSLDTCKFWTKVFKKSEFYDVQKTVKTWITPKRSRFKIINIINSKVNWDFDENKHVIENLEKIYNSIFQIKNNLAIIDSSKNPTQGLALYRHLNIDVKTIYLKRDIRAVTMSKIKWRTKKTGKKLNMHKILLETKLYDQRATYCYNQIKHQDKIKISYEELSKEPQVVIDRILKKFGLSSFEVPNYFYLEDDHTISGTPNRFKKSKIKYDDSWEIKVHKKTLFNLIAKIIDKI